MLGPSQTRLPEAGGYGGPGRAIGRDALRLLAGLFGAWADLRAEPTQRPRFVRRARQYQWRLRRVLERGQQCGCDKTANFCTALLKLWPALVDLRDRARASSRRTTRPSKRSARPCSGARAASARRAPPGNRFVERLLSVAATCKQHDRSLLAYLTAVCTAAQRGQPIPSLLPAPPTALHYLSRSGGVNAYKGSTTGSGPPNTQLLGMYRPNCAVTVGSPSDGPRAAERSRRTDRLDWRAPGAHVEPSDAGGHRSMASPQPTRLLTINVGSSSLKAVLYRVGPAETVEVRVAAERIGIPNSSLRVADAQGAVLLERSDALPGPRCRAGRVCSPGSGPQRLDDGLCAIGQRIVQGGSQYSAPTLITDTRARGSAVAGVRSTRSTCRRRSSVDRGAFGAPIRALPQVACFDTAFHRQMPRVAQMYALPRDLWDAGVRRYGFHGLSYEYILQELRALDGAAARRPRDRRPPGQRREHGRRAPRRRRRHDDGLHADRRPGDGHAHRRPRSGRAALPARSRGLDAAALSRLVNKQAGLLGVSGTQRRHAGPARARGDGSARRRGGRAVLLPGAEVPRRAGRRARRAGHAGLHRRASASTSRRDPRAHLRRPGATWACEIDAARNAAHAPIISSDASRVVVRVMPTDEDLMIARHTYRLIAEEGAACRPRMSSTSASPAR